MPPEIALLNNYLLVGAVLFGVGLIGFVSRRNMIVMFLSAEIMLQGVSLSLVAWSRFRNDSAARCSCCSSLPWRRARRPWRWRWC